MTHFFRFGFVSTSYSRPTLLITSVKGFSLVEILVSLIIVSLAAVNITGLQKKIAEQQRNNIAHAAVLSIATKKMETALSFETVDQLILMNNVSEILTDDVIGEITIDWQVINMDEMNSLMGDFKKIILTISWVNESTQTQSFNYSSEINLGSLLSIASTLDSASKIEQVSSIIPSTLNTNEVIYFEPNMNYKAGAFVIFDSYLYQTTRSYVAGDEPPHSGLDPDSGLIEIGEGWQSFGLVNNPELANMVGLSTEF